MPQVSDPILFIEVAEGSNASEFTRKLASILLNVPNLYNVNFGHAQPIFTFSIGGQVQVDTGNKQLKITW